MIKTIQLTVIQKKWSILISIYICISLTVLISLYLSSHGIKNYLENRAYDEYGEFDGVLYDKPIDDTIHARYGIVGLTEPKENEYKISLGWMSKDMIDFGRIKIIDGKMPDTENEVVVEEFVLSLFDNQWHIGETRSFIIQGKEYNLKLSGIIENYSYRWSYPYEFNKGVNDFPNIILSNKINEGNEFYAIKIKGSIGNKEDKIFEIFSDPDKGFANSKLYYEGLIDYETITKTTTFFYIIIIILVVICLSLAFSYYKANYYTKLGIYKAIGFSNKKIIKLEIKHLCILFLISTILSIPLIYIVTNIFVNYTFGFSFYQFDLKTIIGVIFWLLIIFILYVYITVKQIEDILKNSPFDLLKGAKSTQQYIYKHMYDNIYIDHVLRHITSSTKSFLKHVFIFAFCIISVFFALYLEKESKGIWNINEDYFIEHSGYSFIHKNNQLILLTEIIPFNYDKINQLKENPYIESIYGNPFMIDVVPLLPSNKISNNLANFLEANFPDESGRALIDSQRQYSLHTDLPWNNVRYLLVDQNEYQKLLIDNNIETLVNKNENRLLILLPEDSYLEGEDFNQLDNIVLSKLTLDNNTNYKQKEWLYKLDGVLRDPYYKNEITIVLIGDQAKKNGISKGFTSLDIKLKDNLNNTELKTINNEILNTIASVPDVIFQNLNTFRIEDTNIARYVGFIGTFNFWVICLLVSLSMYLMVFGNFLANKQRWGIYLANGLTKGKVIGLLCSEIIASYLVGVFLSVLFFIIIVSNGVQLSLIYYIQDLLFGISITLVFFLALCLCLFFRIKSLSILSLIRS